MSVKKPKKKPQTLEALIQKYYETPEGAGKKMLLGLIKLKDPKFKG